jgi:hypothetical protein
MKKTIYSILVLIIFVLSWNYSYAYDRKRFKVCNNTGSACNYFQAKFSGTGGNLSAVIIVNPCGVSPTITIAPGDIAVFTWLTNCVANGSCVTFDVYSTNGPLVFVSGNWANLSVPNMGAITLGVNLTNIPILILNSNCFLPTGNQFRSSNPFYQNGPNSFFDVFAEVAFCQPMPVSGSSNLNGMVTVHGNSSSGAFSVTAPATFAISFDHTEDNTNFYNTEMLGLDMYGTGMPSNIRLRESPIHASTGKTTVTDIGGGEWVVESFFDVYTELSVDNGMAWQPAQSGPSHLEFYDNSPVINIPTLTEWGLIIFGVLLLTVGAAFIIRRRRKLAV